MKFHISGKGIKGVTISHSAGSGVGVGGGGLRGKGSGEARLRQISRRAVALPAALVLALLLSFLFLRAALLVLESANNTCSSSSSPAAACMRWRFFDGSDAALLREELTRALLEATKSDGNSGSKDGSNSMPGSYMELVKDMTTSNSQDITAFAFKTKAMMIEMEHLVRAARRRELLYWHIASHSLPKSLHCLSLKLAEEFSVNAMARSRLPPPEFVPRLTDNSFHHVILLTDNVLAASVAISSATKCSIEPEKLVFHIVTDKKSYTPMHAWFSENSIRPAVVEVKGLHEYEWPHRVNVGIKEMLEIHRLIWRHRYEFWKAEDFENEEEYEKNLEVLQPSCISLLNHLRVYLPELFPGLNRIVFLDDDVVVQHDLSPLWDLDLNGKVVGAVIDSCEHNCCIGRKYKDYFNFTNPVISSVLDSDRCGWLYGMNVFDLRAWRKTNITATYHQWLRHSLKSGFELWRPGALPPALIAFRGHVQEIDPSWHLAGLGSRSPPVDTYRIKTAAVIHFSGPAKPWLEVAAPELRNLWYRHVNFSNESLKKCGITG